MTLIIASELVERLKLNANLLRVENYENTKVWFSTHIPAELPMGSKAIHVTTEKVPLPFNHYCVTANELSGWMTFSWHLGGHVSGATAFIAVSPLGAGRAIVEIELVEPLKDLVTSTNGRYLYGFESSDYLAFLGKGLISGLQTPTLMHPLADVKIRILNAISDKIDSSAKAFGTLGEWLIWALIFEMYKQGWIRQP